MADMLRSKTDRVAGMDLLEVRRAIAGSPRSELTVDGRQYPLGPVLADLCITLLLVEGKEEIPEKGPHKSFPEVQHDLDYQYSVRQLRGARELGEKEGLLEAEAGWRPRREKQRTLYWRLNLWNLLKLVLRKALKDAREKLETEGRRGERDKLNKKRRQLERALTDLNLAFLPDAEEAPEPAQESGKEATEDPSGVMTSCAYRDDKLSGIHKDTQKVTFVDVPSTPVGGAGKEKELMIKIYNYLKDHGIRLTNKEFLFNLKQIGSMLKQDNPSGAEIEALPESSLEFYVVHGKLDVAKALRRARQQAAREKLLASQAGPKPNTEAGRVSRIGEKAYDRKKLMGRRGEMVIDVDETTPEGEGSRLVAELRKAREEGARRRDTGPKGPGVRRPGTRATGSDEQPLDDEPKWKSATGRVIFGRLARLLMGHPAQNEVCCMAGDGATAQEIAPVAKRLVMVQLPDVDASVEAFASDVAYLLEETAGEDG